MSPPKPPSVDACDDAEPRVRGGQRSSICERVRVSPLSPRNAADKAPVKHSFRINDLRLFPDPIGGKVVYFLKKIKGDPFRGTVSVSRIRHADVFTDTTYTLLARPTSIRRAAEDGDSSMGHQRAMNKSGRMRSVPRIITPMSNPRRTPSTAVVERLRGADAARQRERITAERPLCPMCKARGAVRAGVELDHIKPLMFGGDNADANMQLLCVPCHREKTATEMNWSPRGTGVDGWPTNPRHQLGPKAEHRSVLRQGFP